MVADKNLLRLSIPGGKMSYTQLTQIERYQMSVLLQQEFSVSEIAKILKRHKSTLYRELKRNKGHRGYRPKQAHEKSLNRRYNSTKSIRLTKTIRRKIIKKIKLEWSPEQIENHINYAVSHETIYKMIHIDRINNGDIYTYLRQGHRKRRKKYGTGISARGHLKNRVSIDERPAIVNTNSRLGHWEGDTIIGKNHKGAILTLVERKSKLVKISLMQDKSSDSVKKAILELLKNHKSKVKTITFDNGKEFACHEDISKKLKAKIYFAHPYSSWERGLNENTNGLLRQYFPKKTDFSKINKKDIAIAQKKLNLRPRKKLGFKTPLEVFRKAS